MEVMQNEGAGFGGGGGGSWAAIAELSSGGSLFDVDADVDMENQLMRMEMRMERGKLEPPKLCPPGIGGCTTGRTGSSSNSESENNNASNNESDDSGQGGGCPEGDCDTLWDFSDQIKKWKNDVKAQKDKGIPVSAYSINAYIDAYENAAFREGRTYVTANDVISVDEAFTEALMTVLPIGKLANFAGKGYKLIMMKNGFYYFEKTKIAGNLPGQARSVYQKVYNEQGKLIRMNKRDYKVDGRMYQNKPKYPNFQESKKLN
ncbi:MAG: hypothetical protein AUK33_03995 [Flavobacteriaceae bacterium CG2_30_34_30]|nr:hypothetical protein [Flavobacteriia bacterium]OIP51589.1 MAG: hypothetical protein AUK33_03995 [Flavobacteriaceae bacterium CG2_30_34_30]PIV49708.1 MAG: hypothetical protein COS19_07235 [Flavobacteriaceae bacterium CG02_land_8_20_14_3_00_34_13]